MGDPNGGRGWGLFRGPLFFIPFRVGFLLPFGVLALRGGLGLIDWGNRPDRREWAVSRTLVVGAEVRNFCKDGTGQEKQGGMGTNRHVRINYVILW
jgi:hypothetical protein